MKKCIVVGSFGCGNKGDDAILDALSIMINNRYELIPTVGNYGGIEQIIRGKTISLRLNEGFSLSVIKSVICFLFRYIFLLSNVDAVIIGGGSLLHDITFYNLPFYIFLQFLAKLKKKPVYYIGVGAGPIKRRISKKQIMQTLNKSNGVLVRDPADYQLLVDLGVKTAQVTADNVFGAIGHSEIETILKDNELLCGEYIVITACEWFSSENYWNKDNLCFQKDEEKLKNSIIQLYNVVQKKIVFLPTVMHDYRLGMSLEKDIDASWFLCLSDKYSCREMAAIVSNSYMLYGMRMHSIIFAIRSGVPFIASIYDEKVRHLLKRVGMEQFALDFDEIDSEMFTNKLKELLSQKDEIKQSLLNQSKMLGKLVRSQIDKALG